MVGLVTTTGRFIGDGSPGVVARLGREIGAVRDVKHLQASQLPAVGRAQGFQGRVAVRKECISALVRHLHGIEEAETGVVTTVSEIGVPVQERLPCATDGLPVFRDI